MSVNGPSIDQRAVVVGDTYEGYADDLTFELQTLLESLPWGPINLARVRWVLIACLEQEKARKQVSFGVSCEQCGMLAPHSQYCPVVKEK